MPDNWVQISMGIESMHDYMLANTYLYPAEGIRGGRLRYGFKNFESFNWIACEEADQAKRFFSFRIR